MKLITFNTWGGRAGLSLIQSFLQKHQDTDVFCLQEIWQTLDESLIEHRDPRIVTDLLEQIASCLPEHQFYFRPQYRGIYGLALFVRKSIPVASEGELFVFKEQSYENPQSSGNHARNIQYATLMTSQGPVTVINFHGLWNGMGKEDSADRMEQSQKIAAFIQNLNHPFILAGDFNLNPETESFKILKGVCARDLVKEYEIMSTRSCYYEKPGKFADYILMGPGLQVNSFDVLPDEASDHLALQIEFGGDNRD